MLRITINNLTIYRFDKLAGYPGIKHFVTTRNYPGRKDFNICLFEEIQGVLENRKILATELNIPFSKFVFQQQNHTDNVYMVGSDDINGSNEYYTQLKDNDAMVTSEKGICLVLIAGDCVPVLFYDPVKQVIGAAHSGWRGTAKRIAEQTVKQMISRFGCQPSDIVAGIGPSIGPDNYEVDDVVLESFSKTYQNTSEFIKPGKTEGKYQLNLWKANRIQLLDTGLSQKNIEVSGICTYAYNNEFFSARRGDIGRFGCGIMLI